MEEYANFQLLCGGLLSFYNFYLKSSILSAKFWNILIMALKATIYKADLNIANMDDHIYGDYQLTLALHPSETLERLMVRLMAFARFASDELEFTKDLFETDEPALWQKDLTGQLETWIEVGLPSEDKVKKPVRVVKRLRLLFMVHKSKTGGSETVKLKP